MKCEAITESSSETGNEVDLFVEHQPRGGGMGSGRALLAETFSSGTSFTAKICCRPFRLDEMKRAIGSFSSMFSGASRPRRFTVVCPPPCRFPPPPTGFWSAEDNIRAYFKLSKTVPVNIHT